MASNPVNFGKLTKLSTAEALAAALYIAGFKDSAEEILSIFTWGHTFFELNKPFLDKYTVAKDSEDIIKIQKMLFESNSNKSKP